MWERFSRFLADLRREWSKISWPSLKEVNNSTGIVIVSVLVVSFYLWICDMCLSWGIGTIIGRR